MDAVEMTDKIEVGPTAVLANTTKYEIEVKTGAETESVFETQELFLSVFGTTNNLLDMLVDRESSVSGPGDLFQAGKLDRFVLYAKNVGAIRKVALRHESESSWNLSYIKIRAVGEEYTFTTDQRIDEGRSVDLLPGDVPKAESGKNTETKPVAVVPKAQTSQAPAHKQDVTNYEIQVKTASELGAGTEAAIRLVLFGTNGDLANIQLKESETNENPFERGQLDRFFFNDMDDVGIVRGFCLFSDFLLSFFRINKFSCLIAQENSVGSGQRRQ
jgi:hypothetical protein